MIKRILLLLAITMAACGGLCGESPMVLRYSHMNASESIAGKQADFFAAKVKELSKGGIVVEMYPNSQLGTIQEQASQVSKGIVAFQHNTAGGISSLIEDIGVLDTPFLYKDVKQLLTADRAIKKPADLKGLKIRSIPSAIYQTAVEGLGAIATPIDWAETVADLREESGSLTDEAHSFEKSTRMIEQINTDLSRISGEVVTNIGEISAGLEFIGRSVKTIGTMSDRVEAIGNELDTEIRKFRF